MFHVKHTEYEEKSIRWQYAEHIPMSTKDVIIWRISNKIQIEYQTKLEYIIT